MGKRPLQERLTDRADASEGERPSRAQRTREVKEINRLGLRLVALSPLKLDRIELSEDLRDAITHCRSLTKGAHGRQKRMVCKLLREEDHEAIRKQLERL